MSTYCTATVINHKEIVPGVWKMELAAPEIAKTARPGQFIQLYPPDERNLLARPISLSSISKMSVTIVYRVVGKGTNNISKVVSKISRPAKGRLLYYSILGGNFG